MLNIENLTASYGDAVVLRGLSLDVKVGEVVGLLGLNGAGKTTLIRSILGQTEISSGLIRYESQDLTDIAPHKIPQLGIGIVPQGNRVFPGLTVRENLLAMHEKVSLSDAHFGKVLRDFPILSSRMSQIAGTLSGGEQQMLALARASLSNPKLMLLDEPTEGLMPELVSSLSDKILLMKNAGKGILLAEQNIDMARAVSDRIVVIADGVVAWTGSKDEIVTDQLETLLGLNVN
jgi:branched-chain amino acid transport system ATP-binding protein